MSQATTAKLTALVSALPMLLLIGAASVSCSGGSSGNDATATDANPADAAGSDAAGGDAATDVATEAAGDVAPEADAVVSIPGTVNFVSGVMVSTLAGSATSGSTDGSGAAARFDNPTGVAIDASGNLFVTDYDGGLVRRITPAGDVTTIGKATGFALPFSAAVMPTSGVLVIGTDADNTGTKGATTGTVWRLAQGGAGVAAPTVIKGGMGRPRGLCGLSDGRLFVADRRRGVVSILDIGTGALTDLAGQDGVTAYTEGKGAAAAFNNPYGCAQQSDGSVLVADMSNHVIRRVTLDGTVSTFAGTGAPGTHDAAALSARFNIPRDLAIDSAGNVYVVDMGVSTTGTSRLDVRVRRISTSGTVETLAGDGNAGFVEGAGSAAEFYGLEGVDVTPNGKTVYVSDGNGGDGTDHHRIREITVP